MSTKQDIYAAGSEIRPPMLNKENYVPWLSRLLRYAKSRPNEKLIHNSILNGPYVRRLISKPGDANREVNVTGTFHLQIDDELSEKELKKIEADDQAIQTILLGLPEEIYATVDTGFESRPPMLNKENYAPWSSRLLRYAKSRPNGKLIHKSILNGPYVRKMIPELGDANREITVTETFYLQTEDELSDKEHKQIEADDQAIQTILLGLPEDIFVAVDSCETAQEIWLRVQQMMKGSDIGIQEKKAKNKHFPEKIASNLKFLNILQPEWSQHVTIVHQTKDLHTADYTQLYDFLKYNQKERISSNTRNKQIAQPGMNMGQDRQMKMVGCNGGNQFRQYAGNPAGYNDVIGNQVIQNAVQNLRVQNVRNQNGLIGVQGNGNQNQIGNGNFVAARAERNAAGQNGNQIRCYNYRGVGHYARNCTVRPRRRDAAYLQTQLLITQKEEAGI
nr:hypothetical protein [Tanacetum cinerariifolium]